MKDSQIDAQYSTGLSRDNIERALVAAGLDLGRLQPADLGALEDFHTMGRIATSQLAELAKITSQDKVLDAGSGIGGTARFLADRYRCAVTAIDLTEEYCETARWLNRLVGLDNQISVRRGDVTDLPFADAGFDVVASQHVQMNVADKARLYGEARRVLVPGGRLAIWDITAGQLRAAVESAGFTVEHWDDLTDPAAALMEAVLSRPAGPLGLHAFVDNFAAKAANLTQGLSSGRLRAIQGIARAAG